MERPESADNPDREDADVASDAAVRAAEAFDPGEEPSGDPSPGRQAGRIARSTAFFSVATAASRIAGLVREIVAAGYYGVNGPMSAFTIAFQVPNLVRALFADAALQPAFVPIFTEQLEKGNTREAFRLASTLLLLVTLVLGSITAVFVLLAPVIMPLVAPGFSGEILDLTVTLSQILFPILILLGVSGVVVGILNSYDRFGAFAISPLFWNLTIIAALVFLIPQFEGQDRIYAYAIGILRRHPGPADDPGLGPPQHAVQVQMELRMAEPRRPPGTAADAAGDDQPRADQLQPDHQQPLRQPRQRRGAGGDRQGVPDLPAAAGDLLGRDRDGPVPDPGPVRRPRRDRRPAGDDGERDAPDPLHPGAGGRRRSWSSPNR